MTVKSLKNLKEYYRTQLANECIQIHDGDFYQIVLVRHGEPDINKKYWYGSEEILKYASSYDVVGVKNIVKNPICINDLPVDKVYHSSLPRAEHTAQLLFGRSLNLVSDPRFREFEKSIIRLSSYFPMPLGFWLTLSRIFWFLGFHTTEVESFMEAKARIKANAEYLLKKIKKEKIVIIVAHGWHNRYIIKYFESLGWAQVYKGGNGYLSLNIVACQNQFKK